MWTPVRVLPPGSDCLARANIACERGLRAAYAAISSSSKALISRAMIHPCLKGCEFRWAKEGVLEGKWWSGWSDSNRRHPAPKAGALTGLRHTPTHCKK